MQRSVLRTLDSRGGEALSLHCLQCTAKKAHVDEVAACCEPREVSVTTVTCPHTFASRTVVSGYCEACQETTEWACE